MNDLISRQAAIDFMVIMFLTLHLVDILFMRLAKPSVEILSEVILSMAKIRNSKPKQSGGYERLVDNKDMASIFTKAQSTVSSKYHYTVTLYERK